MGKRGDQTPYGICVFDDNRQCELIALSKELCKKGGVKVTGYATDAARYCAITGGVYIIRAHSNTPKEAGICSRNNASCDVWKYFKNICVLP